ncbi:Gp138-N domain-containing protein [Fusobacterium necrophorum subsp. funduliforme]|uniref:Gp138 family membrane-puncturing spike protein n=1 Tax=Fusobacterium necrophorum TaxID=859 RepID=UPI00370DE7D9
MIELVQAMIQDASNEIHTSLPAVITEVNHAVGTCTVQIIPKRELCGQVMSYPPLIDVKLDFLKFGGWKFQFPRKPGDKVWIGFSEATLSEDTSLERFSLNEPYVIGSCEDSYEENSEDIILEGKGTRIEIKGNGEIIITTGSNEMTINSNITLNGNLTHNGNTTQSGNVSVEGSVGASVDVTGGGISLKKHTHKYYPGGDPSTQTDPAS